MKKLNRTSLFILGSFLCFILGKFNFLANSYAQAEETKINQELQTVNNKNSKKDSETKGKQTTIKSQSSLKGTQPTTICLK